jgi:hypothetical protein
MSVDGTDFRIQEPTIFDRSYYSHKFKSAGLRYEVCLNLFTGDIVWANGGYPCGSHPDLLIARDGLVNLLDYNEKVIADRSYNDFNYFTL